MDDPTAIVADLLRAHPAAAVALIDAARNLGDASELAGFGVDVDGHSVLRGRSPVEFIDPRDAIVLSEAGHVLKHERQSIARQVRLRDGHVADLHIVVLDEPGDVTVVVVVPAGDQLVADTPPPPTVESGPRVGLLCMDADGLVIDADESAAELLGRGRADLAGEPAITLVAPDHVEAAIVNWVAAMERRNVPVRWRSQLQRSDDVAFDVECTLVNAIDNDGSGDIRWEIVDVSSEVAAVRALEDERALLEQLAEALPVGVAMVDVAGQVGYANHRLSDLLCHDRLPTTVADLVGACGDAAGALVDAFRGAIGDGRDRAEVARLPGPGRPRVHEWTFRALQSPSRAIVGAIICVADVTEPMKLRDELVHQAHTDPLTGCHNRAATVQAIDDALALVGTDKGVAVAFIDLNDFKRVNDDHGHAAGDAVLRCVAEQLRAITRSGDVVGRLGGDEFVVCVGSALPSSASELGLRINTALARVETAEAAAGTVTASVGVAWTGCGPAAELLAAADQAMYAAKRSGSTRPMVAPHREQSDAVRPAPGLELA